LSKNKIIEREQIGWETAVVMVCTKCGKQFEDSHLKEAPERIKSELKSVIKMELGKSIRVITTSCLNICPVDKIAIAIASSSSTTVFKAYGVDPDSSGEELYKTIILEE
jgi:predicted metal-binding protein